MSRSPFVIALEGPSYSGKSTLGKRLAATLEGRGCLLPCYVDVAGGDAFVPESRAGTPEQQLRSFDFFLDLDRQRSVASASCLASAEWVVADRCWLSLIAHVYAVARTGGPDIHEAARASMAAADGVLQPSVVLYLAVSEQRRRERIPSAELGSWPAATEINAELARFYGDVAASILPVALCVVDGDADASTVHDRACAVVEAARAEGSSR